MRVGYRLTHVYRDFIQGKIVYGNQITVFRIWTKSGKEGLPQAITRASNLPRVVNGAITQIMTLFQQNYTKGQEEDEKEIVEANHFFEEDELPTFLTEEGQFSQESFIPSDQQLILTNDDLWAMKIEEYQRGYQNALSHLQKQYNLRSRNVPVTLNQKRKNVQKGAQDK